MLDLLLAADEAAKTANQKMLLEALMENDGRGIQRVMERDSHHDILLEDSFFTPFMGLMAAHGSREAWRTMKDWGYSMQSELRSEKNPLEMHRTTLGSWACQFLPPERLSSLIDWKILTPFDCRSGKSQMHAGEYGMLGGSNELFDFWLGQWKEYLANNPHPIGGHKSLPILLETASGMLRWEKEQTDYPEIFPSKDELWRRVDGIVSLIAERYWDNASNKQEQWNAFTKDPIKCSKAWPVSVFVDSMIKHVDNPWHDPKLLEDAIKGRNFQLVAGLIRAGIPLDTPYGEKVPIKILQVILETTEDNACAWHAWCDRARAEFPQKLASLPHPLTSEHASVRSYFIDSKAKRKVKLQAIELLLSTDEPPAPRRSGPRL